MSKLTVMIKAFYENLIYIEDLCAQTKKTLMKTKQTYPLLLHSSYSFLNCWKTTKPMTLKFLDFQFTFVNWFDNCMSRLFLIADVPEKGRIFFLIFWCFQTPPSQNEAKYFHKKCWDKSALIEKTLKLAKIQKAKKKYN